ncbi:MBL fold metallo-hydrolase [Psychrobacillus sp. NEAU-3TGS]|uniref:MBL fold metallo-hydrolase n=1 Tax=Psychrobacillus sp. NEAU-3TGS TaxID=2995412 RepID=UPI0024991ADB|nr:MBL fold metallo-hydrolase [Psychrobacillus sp. NEAU-3TGS]MDI2586816.1 MBL fold metallo-hydrolase [Psychrobacillus sp. NEAU-3TGS]
MTQSIPIQLNDRIHLIDGHDLGVTERTGIYVIQEEELTIVETSASPSIKYVKEGLKVLGISLDEVKYIIVTHIHLDHAGGAGLLMQDCPNAKVVVHPKGARHLADPSRLITGAKAVYGDKFSGLFEPILPIAEERLIVKGEGETLEIGPNCQLLFLDTPGHANHHFSIYDPISNGMFTGDTVGVRYPQLVPDNVHLFLPSTSPNQFNPDAMQRAMDGMEEMQLDTIYFGHYGMTNDPAEVFRQVSTWLKVYVDEAKTVYAEQKGYEVLAERLESLVREHLRGLGIPDDHEVYSILQLDIEVSAMGLLDYLSK